MAGRGQYSMADIATFPWAARHEWQEIDLEPSEREAPFDSIASRPACNRPHDPSSGLRLRPKKNLPRARSSLQCFRSSGITLGRASLSVGAGRAQKSSTVSSSARADSATPAFSNSRAGTTPENAAIAAASFDAARRRPR